MLPRKELAKRSVRWSGNTPGVDWFRPDHPRAVLEGGPRPDSGPVPGRASWHNKHKEAPAGSLELTDLDVLPEPEPVGDLLHRRTRRFVGPGRARVASAVDNNVVELDAVRTGAIRRGLIRLLQPFGAHRRGRKILVTVAFDDVVALGDDFTFHACPHAVLRQPQKSR